MNIHNSKDKVLDYIRISNSKDKVLVYIYIYTYIHNSKDKVLDYIYTHNSKDRVLDYIYITPRTKSWTTYVSYLKKKTSLFRTLPVRQTSYCFVMVLAIVFIFKDHILVYICSNLHIYIYVFNTYIYLYISVVLINYIYLGFISCRAPKVPKSAHPITARYKMMRPPHFTTKCML